MKRTATIFSMLFVAALGLAAAVWDGSAVAGGSGDFADDGLYGACNSFPRDTTVTVTNLENGKTVTVTITRGVDNPGVFIALSPKAASALGMQSGTSARIRAVALTASQAETSLPPARAGETADPDYNPKVYVDREKAAVAAAAAQDTSKASAAEAPAQISAPAAAVEPAAPVAAAPAAPAPAAVAAAPAAAVQPQPAAPAAAPAEAPKAPAQETPQTAEVMAKVEELPKEPVAPLPKLTEPAAKTASVAQTAAAPAQAATAAQAATPVQAATPAQAAVSPPAVAKTEEKQPKTKIPADNLPLPEASTSFPGSPRPAPLAVALPNPDTLPLTSSAEPKARTSNVAQAPEILDDATPSPRKPGQVLLAAADPALPTSTANAAASGAASAPAKAPAAAAETPKAVEAPKAPEKASVVDLAKPSSSLKASTSPARAALAEPIPPELKPDELPDAVLSRITAPAMISPVPVLAEAPARSDEKVEGPEALALEKPSYSKEVEAAALAEASLKSEAPATGPVALALERPSLEKSGAAAELADATEVSPSESYSSEKPGKAGGESSAVELAEAELPGSPEAIADRRKAQAGVDLAELQTPDAPNPSESLSADRPARGEGASALAELADPEVSSPAENGNGPTAIADQRKAPASGALGDAAALAEPEAATPASTGAGPAAIADLRKTPARGPVAALEDPSVPSPTESVGDLRPNAVAPGVSVAVLAEPDAERAKSAPAAAEVAPPLSPEAATAIILGKPSMSGSPGETELENPDVPNPSESIAAERPNLASAAELSVTLEPAAPKPPVSASPAAPAVAVAVPEAPAPKAPEPAIVATITSPSPNGAAQAPASVPMIKGLAKGSFYIQVGVFGTNDALKSAIAGFRSTYPLAVESVSTSKGGAAYRLFIGPLSRDEGGVVLLRIRALGFKDAYLRQGS